MKIRKLIKAHSSKRVFIILSILVILSSLTNFLPIHAQEYIQANQDTQVIQTHQDKTDQETSTNKAKLPIKEKFALLKTKLKNKTQDFMSKYFNQQNVTITTGVTASYVVLAILFFSYNQRRVKKLQKEFDLDKSNTDTYIKILEEEIDANKQYMLLNESKNNQKDLKEPLLM